MAKLILCFLVYIFCVVDSHAVAPARIVKGKDAPELAFPFMVSITLFRDLICGGSIVAPKFILTAAHCVSDKSTTTIKFYVLRVGSRYHNRGGVVVHAKKKIVHEGYADNKFVNDIALLELEKPLKYGHNIMPISLPKQRILDGKSAIIMGWGSADGSKSNSPNKLQLATTTVAKMETCRINAVRRLKSVVCLQSPQGRAACYGDSGGPAIDKEGKLVGISVFGIKCRTPSIYADVFYYVDWIQKRIHN